jgi:NADH dehydrogenase [ubiquinone] 1 alpha subcomplex assembly factor 7
MTPLAQALASRIGQAGPISVASFMAAALSDPKFGYYRTSNPLGTRGDFITAPEISQMFGELVGIWCMAVFERIGAPSELCLIELGPGRGSLMADLLRAAKIRPAFQAAARIHLVEINPQLRRMQQEMLAGATWHESFAEAAQCGDMPLVVIANEFFDALPIHQLERNESGWRERMVAFDPATESFRFVTAPEETPPCALVPAKLRDEAPGSIFEVSPDARALMAAIAAALVARGGAALVIDYGHEASAIGETLQAVRGHRYHDPLTDPGLADITAHVDFEALTRAACGRGAEVFGPTRQGVWLRRLGIEARAQALMSHAGPGRAPEIAAAQSRLIDGDKMGSLFRALMVARPGLGAIGFETADSANAIR